MVKKCIYCGDEISSSCVIDFCEKCGIGVFGKKMFDTIIKNMEEARENGDLCHDKTLVEAEIKTDNFGGFDQSLLR